MPWFGSDCFPGSVVVLRRSRWVRPGGVLSRRFRLVPLLPSVPWNATVPWGSWTGRPALFPIGSFGGILRLVLGVRITSVWFVKNFNQASPDSFQIYLHIQCLFKNSSNDVSSCIPDGI